MRAILLIAVAALLHAQNGQQPNYRSGWPCPEKPRSVDPAYVLTSEASGGQVFLFDRSEVQGFALLAAGHSGHPVTIARGTGTVENYVDLRVPVDPSIESLFVSVSLQCMQRVIIYDPQSRDVRADQNGGQDQVFVAGRIATVAKPEPGVWTVRLLGSGQYFAVVEAKTPLGVHQVTFQGGKARAGVEQTISVRAPDVAGLRFRLIDAAGQELQPLDLRASPDSPGLYVGKVTLPAKRFRVAAEAIDAQGFTVQRIDPHLYEGQR